MGRFLIWLIIRVTPCGHPLGACTVSNITTRVGILNRFPNNTLSLVIRWDGGISDRLLKKRLSGPSVAALFKIIFCFQLDRLDMRDTSSNNPAYFLCNCRDLPTSLLAASLTVYTFQTFLTQFCSYTEVLRFKLLCQLGFYCQYQLVGQPVYT